MFPSTGDAAGFLKFCRQTNSILPESLTVSGLDIRSLNPDAECVVFVNAKNNVGDPVIRDVQNICERNNKITYLIFGVVANKPSVRASRIESTISCDLSSTLLVDIPIKNRIEF